LGHWKRPDSLGFGPGIWWWSPLFPVPGSGSIFLNPGIGDLGLPGVNFPWVNLWGRGAGVGDPLWKGNFSFGLASFGEINWLGPQKESWVCRGLGYERIGGPSEIFGPKVGAQNPLGLVGPQKFLGGKESRGEQLLNHPFGDGAFFSGTGMFWAGLGPLNFFGETLTLGI